MDDQTFRDRLGDELLSEKPPEATYKGWFRKVAIGTDIPQDSLRGYAEGTQKCPGDRLLALFDYFGPAFEARVRGNSEAPPPDLAKLAAHLEATLKTLGQRDEANVIAADFAQRTGHK